jgi:photosystem II stability/assembly factor-like uncharacterized protein
MLRLRFTSVASSVAIAVAAACAAAIGAAGSVSANLNSLPADSGIVTAFAFETGAPGSVFAATIGGRVYKATDAGGGWRSTTTGLGWSRVDALVVDPRRPATLYAGTGVAVFKTVNGGRSWRGANRGLLPPPPVVAVGQVTGTPGWRRAEGWVGALAVDPTDSRIVYAGTGGGVRKSTDGGRSWRTVLWHGRYTFVSALVIAPTSPRVVYAAAFALGPADCGPPGQIPCSQRSQLLYRSADGGKTWRPTSLRPANPQGYPMVLALDLRRPTTLYAAAGRAVFRSTDAGRNWRSITDGLPAKRDITSLAVDPRGSGIVYAGVASSGSISGGIFKTTNGGRTWSRANSGFPVTTLAVDPARPATIYAAVDRRKYRILKSTDSGQTWAIAG